MGQSENGMTFKLTILGEAERKAGISYIRKTKPDYLLEINGLKVKYGPGESTEEYTKFPDSLDYFFYLNYGDLFTCAVNVFEEPEILHHYVSLLLSELVQKREVCNAEIEHCLNSRGLKKLNSSRLAQLNIEYKELAAAVTFCSAQFLAIHEDEKKDGLFSAATSVLLMTSKHGYGAVSPEILQRNLKENNLFSEIEAKIRYYGDGSEEYTFQDFFSLIGFEVRKLINKHCEIKVCENCGRFFIPATRSDEKYCDFPFRGKKTCKNVAFTARLDNDKVLKTYRKIYKTQNARKQRNGHRAHIAEYFEQWARFAKKKLQQCQDGEITLTQMIDDISTDNWMNGTFFDS